MLFSVLSRLWHIYKSICNNVTCWRRFWRLLLWIIFYSVFAVNSKRKKDALYSKRRTDTLYSRWRTDAPDSACHSTLYRAGSRKKTYYKKAIFASSHQSSHCQYSETKPSDQKNTDYYFADPNSNTFNYPSFSIII